MRNRLVFNEDSKLQPGLFWASWVQLTYACKQPIATRDYYNYFFYPRTISKGNKLPREIALSSSPAAFKTICQTNNLKDKGNF